MAIKKTCGETRLMIYNKLRVYVFLILLILRNNTFKSITIKTLLLLVNIGLLILGFVFYRNLEVLFGLIVYLIIFDALIQYQYQVFFYFKTGRCSMDNLQNLINILITKLIYMIPYFDV